MLLQVMSYPGYPHRSGWKPLIRNGNWITGPVSSQEDGGQKTTGEAIVVQVKRRKKMDMEMEMEMESMGSVVVASIGLKESRIKGWGVCLSFGF